MSMLVVMVVLMEVCILVMIMSVGMKYVIQSRIEHKVAMYLA